jgi:hypothetical protein
LLRGWKSRRRLHKSAYKGSDAHRRHRHRPNKVGRAFAQSCLTTTPRNRSELQLARTPLIWLPRNHHTKATAFLVADKSRQAPTPAEGLVSTPTSAAPCGAEDGQHQPATNQATPRPLGTPTKHHREEALAGADPVPGAESRRPQVHSPDQTVEPPPRPPRPPNHPEVPGPPPQRPTPPGDSAVEGRCTALAGDPIALEGEGPCHPWPREEEKARHRRLSRGLSLVASSDGGSGGCGGGKGVAAPRVLPSLPP